MQQSVNVSGAKGYLIWLATHQPELYERIKPEIARRLPAAALAGLGDDPLVPIAFDSTLISDPVIKNAPEGPSGSWADALTGIIQSVGIGYKTVQQAKAANELNKIQLDRMRAGLPPLNVDPTSLGLQTATFSVGVAPDSRKLLLYLGLAAVAAFALPAVLGRR